MNDDEETAMMVGKYGRETRELRKAEAYLLIVF